MDQNEKNIADNFLEENNANETAKKTLITDSIAVKVNKRHNILAFSLAILSIIIVVGSFFLWSQLLSKNLQQVAKKSGNDINDLFAGFSKLTISAANANDNFELKPAKQDSLGVGTDTAYVLKSKESLETKIIKENLKISPEIGYNIEKVSDKEWNITPVKPVPANTILHVSLAASYLDQSGQQVERDYAWAYQIKDTFKVISTIPRDTGRNVPANTGIEFTFSHDNFVNYEKFFAITPAVPGRFEKHGRTLVFVPNNGLAPGTVYSVIIKSGLPLDGSAEVLAADYEIQFEIAQADQYNNSKEWFYLYNKMIESNTNQEPVLQVNARNIPNNELKANIYLFKDTQQFLESLKEKDKLPYWSYARENYQYDASNLQKLNEFILPIKGESGSQYIQFPDKLLRGYYFIEIYNGNQKQQAWLQITNISAYFNFTKTDSIIWINNVLTKKPEANARIEITNLKNQYLTDQDGVVKFSTPAEFLAENENDKNNYSFYLKISKAEDSLILPVMQLAPYYEWRRPEQASNFWNYLYTDRPLYKPNDTIKFWGLLKNRNSKNIDKPITITLYKEGYVDYYYQPINIVEETLTLSDLNTFAGEFKLNNVRPDYYSLELKVGDDVINRKYINIQSYTKPAYKLTLTPDRKYAYAGEKIKLVAKASFFEGTPVPNLGLVFEADSSIKTVVTNQSGEVNLEYTKDYADCNEQYSCWPKYVYFSIRPEDSELAEIEAGANAVIYGPNVYMNSETEYPSPGKGKITFNTKFIDFDALKAADWWERDLGKKNAPNVKIEGKVKKVTYTKIPSGTHYDFINKRTYQIYSYSRNEQQLDNFSLITNNNGQAIYERNIEPESSYIVDLKVYDSQGRHNVYRQYLYYYNGNYLNKYVDERFSYYYLQLPEDKKGYSIGEEVAAQFMLNDKPLPDGKQKFLFLQLQNGLKDYNISDKSKYSFNFNTSHIPNVNLVGVYFNGSTYEVTQTGYWDDRSIELNLEDRSLKINIVTDKKQYQPGEEVNLSVIVKDVNNNPKQAELNLNLVDEAFYAVADDTASPLETIYSNVDSGILFSGITHESQAETSQGAEKGGCFAAGTLILMNDGSKKPIEKIEVGDQVLTFNNLLERRMVGGEVTKIWQHLVNEYMIINGKIKVTPEHQVYANDHFIDAGMLKIGDWLLGNDNKKIKVNSITIKHKPITVYNFRVEPQHTYFADGVYVHNQEKGGGAREYFTDAALFQTVATDINGRANVKFKLPDNITSWRVTTQAISDDLFAGVNTSQVPVSLPVFAEVTVDNEYLIDDKPIARLRAYGAALTDKDQVTFVVSTPDFGIKTSPPLVSSSFQPVYYSFPRLIYGQHDVTYNLTTVKGDDVIKLPINVVSSRLEAQEVKNEKLTTKTKIKAENNLPIAVVLSDQGRNYLYSPLENLTWSYGDRIDQSYLRKQARLLLNKYYQEDFTVPKFNTFDYQLLSGGLTLLPYSSEELELSTRIAALGADDFDKESLAQYFYKKLEDKNSNKEEVSLALSGLAYLNKPVLPRIQQWLNRADLSVREKLYLAQALLDLGAKEWSRQLYYQIINKYAEKKDPYIVIREGGTADEVFRNTILAAVLATSLNALEADGLWQYLISNQVLYGEKANSEQLFSLEKFNYIRHTLPNLKPSPAKVTLEMFGEKKEINVTGDGVYSFQIDSSQINDIKFLSIEGEVGISTRYIKPIDLNTVTRDESISIAREYYVNNVKIDNFKENDIIQVRIFPQFAAKAIAGDYQITDILPSGLLPITKLSYLVYSGDCHYRYPYNADGQMVKYRINKNWRNNWCGGDYISYYARVKNRGEYKVEPAIIQSYVNPEYINYSTIGTITISQ